MAAFDFLVVENGLQKRKPSAGITPTFAQVVVGTPTQSDHAATKSYVDALSAGLDPKEAVRALTTAPLSGTPDYNNGTSGVGATLTATSNGALSIDGVSVVNGDRVLVAGQANKAHNGIYVVTAAGDGSNPYVLTRALDFDGSPVGEVNGGEYCFVKEGASYADTGWVCSNPQTEVDMGTSLIEFVQFSAAGVIEAGTALEKSVNTLNVKYDNTSVGVNGSNQLEVKADGIDKTKIAADVAGAGLAQNVDGSLEVGAGNGISVAADAVSVAADATGGANLAKAINVSANGVAVKVDDSSIEGDATTGQLKVKALGISTGMIADDAVDKTKIAADVAGAGLAQNVDGSLEVGAGNGISVAADAVSVAADATGGANLAKAINVSANGVAVKVDDSSIEGDATTGQLKVKALGISTGMIADDAVDKSKIASDVAGAGLGQNVDGSLEVTAGDAIQIVSDAVAVDFSQTFVNGEASTAIVAGDVVYIYNDAGTYKVKLARSDVANLHKYELGIALEGFAAAASGKVAVRRGAIVGGFSGLTEGEQYVSATVFGGRQADFTSMVEGEDFVYSVGKAVSATQIALDPVFKWLY